MVDVRSPAPAAGRGSSRSGGKRVDALEVLARERSSSRGAEVSATSKAARARPRARSRRGRPSASTCSGHGHRQERAQKYWRAVAGELGVATMSRSSGGGFRRLVEPSWRWRRAPARPSAASARWRSREASPGSHTESSQTSQRHIDHKGKCVATTTANSPCAITTSAQLAHPSARHPAYFCSRDGELASRAREPLLVVIPAPLLTAAPFNVGEREGGRGVERRGGRRQYGVCEAVDRAIAGCEAHCGGRSGVCRGQASPSLCLGRPAPPPGAQAACRRGGAAVASEPCGVMRRLQGVGSIANTLKLWVEVAARSARRTPTCRRRRASSATASATRSTSSSSSTAAPPAAASPGGRRAPADGG